MSKKYFVFSDVHSFYDELMIALNKAGFDKDNPEHCIISCGDLLDRGDKSINCLKFVNSIPDDRKILIRGNHEDLLVDAMERDDFRSHDYSNGTATTIVDLGWSDEDCGWTFERAKNNPYLKQYIASVVDYAEVGDNIFTHGWIPCYKLSGKLAKEEEKEYDFNPSWRYGDWESARWINGMDAWNNGIKIPEKTIFCGHWHTSWGNSRLHNNGPEWNNPFSTNPEHRKAHFEPFIDEGIVALDACTAYSHKVNVYVFETE